MKPLLLVALGGALGASARYGVAVASGKLLADRVWPWATLVANVLGCAAIGFALAMVRDGSLGPQARLFFVTGILGGLTTFSSFGVETFALAESGRWGLAVLYVAVSVAAGLAALWVAFSVHR